MASLTIVLMNMQQQQERSITYHTVTLGPLTREGDALAEILEQDEAGMQHISTVRVPAGLPGELVTLAVEAAASPPARRRNRHWKPRPRRVEITEIHQPSPLRTSAPCPVFGTCGGCQLQHMHYSAQLEWKRSVVGQLLQDSGGFENPPLLETVPCDVPWNYRNHMRFSVNRNGQAGLTARGTHRVLPLPSCPIAHEYINRALGIFSTIPNARPQLLIRCGAASGQILVQPHPTPEVTSQLTEAGLDVCSETMEERLAGESFRIRPSSFFQTNTAQDEKMVRMVLHGLLDHDEDKCSGGDVTSSINQLSTNLHSTDKSGTDRVPGPPAGSDALYSSYHPMTIIDAYCGVGTFALLLAHHVSKVIAIEESASAIKDAQWNLRHVNNVEILKGKVEALLPSLASQVDGLVIDPPRAGCQPIILDALVQHPVKRIVYVSCDPSTLARDLNTLCHVHPTYHLRSVQPLDMFPQTAHIESVAVLERREL